MENINYYLVYAKCGHVGKGNYLEVAFPVYAKTAHNAAQIVLKRPKVKKHLKNAITSVEEINYDDYLNELESFKNNDYIKAHSKKDLMICELDVNHLESSFKQYKKSFSSRIERVNYILKKNRIKELQVLC